MHLVWIYFNLPIFCIVLYECRIQALGNDVAGYQFWKVKSPRQRNAINPGRNQHPPRLDYLEEERIKVSVCVYSRAVLMVGGKTEVFSFVCLVENQSNRRALSDGNAPHNNI